MVFLIVSVFIEELRQPLFLLISKLIFLGNKETNLGDHSIGLVISITKLTAFLCVLCLLILGSYISYYKIMVKVEVMQKILKCSFYLLIIFFVFTAAHIVIVIVFSSLEATDNKTELLEVTLVAALLSVIFYSLESLFLMYTYRKIKNALALMIKFHDYLIQYRLTPRSRILRKHLPKMNMILEEESQFDTTSHMMSQSMASMSMVSGKQSKLMSIKSENTSMT